MQRLAMLAVCVGVTTIGGCTLQPQAPECLQADLCDQTLIDATGAFANDDGQFGVTGSCWLNGDTANVCAAECQRFLDAEAAQPDASNECKSLVGPLADGG